MGYTKTIFHLPFGIGSISIQTLFTFQTTFGGTTNPTSKVPQPSIYQFPNGRFSAQEGSALTGIRTPAIASRGHDLALDRRTAPQCLPPDRSILFRPSRVTARKCRKHRLICPRGNHGSAASGELCQRRHHRPPSHGSRSTSRMHRSASAGTAVLRRPQPARPRVPAAKTVLGACQPRKLAPVAQPVRRGAYDWQGMLNPLLRDGSARFVARLGYLFFVPIVNIVFILYR